MKRNYFIPLFISGIAFFTTFLFFYYIDLKSLTIWTTNFWDTLFETGNLRNFYEYSARNQYGLLHEKVGNDLLIYFPWAVWNLPIWALQYFGKVQIVEHSWMLLYSKTFLIFMFVLCLFVTRKIAFLIFGEQKKVQETLFLSMTSLFTMVSIAYIGQNDVVVIFFFLLTLYTLLKGKWKTFLLFAAITIALKPFFVFSIVALVLLYEKNLAKDILYFLVIGSVSCIQKLCFYGAPMYRESMEYGPMKDAIDLLLEAKLEIPPVGIPLFVLGMGIVWILSYFQNVKEQGNQKILYFTTVPLILFFIFTRYESYRPFYLIPLLYLLMETKPEYKRMNFLLETVASGMLMYFYMVTDKLFFNPNFMVSLFRKNKESLTIAEWIGERLPGMGIPITSTIFLLTMILIAIINYPNFHKKNEVLMKTEVKSIIYIRSILFVTPFLCSVILKYL